MSLALVKNHETTMLERLLPLVKAFDLIESEIGAFDAAVALARNAKTAGARLFFVGNGGSAAIASHMAADFSKNDVLFAISSSGRSLSIINAVHVALKRNMEVVTLTGFDRDNSLRYTGSLNFYVPSLRYGTVELCHHAILHAILDQVLDVAPR